jgi:hypothetical protein
MKSNKSMTLDGDINSGASRRRAATERINPLMNQIRTDDFLDLCFICARLRLK